MDARSDNSPVHTEPEEPGIAPSSNGVGPPFPGSTTDHLLKPTHLSSPKRSRRSVQKRVVSVPICDADGSRPKGAGEGAPPSDSWAWRKYGQKPIKGSPYPRGYYRCSSSKGCPARKQVERSRVDPTMLVITYSCEHNHPWPLPRNNHHQNSSSAPNPKLSPEADSVPIRTGPTESTRQDEKYADLIGEEPALMMPDDFCWFSDVGPASTSSASTSPPASTETLLYSPICGIGIDGAAADVAMLFPDESDKLAGGGGSGEEEDSLFADLGELPEWSVVFRRGFLERQMRMQMQGEENHGCGLTAASWCGSTG